MGQPMGDRRGEPLPAGRRFQSVLQQAVDRQAVLWAYRLAAAAREKFAAGRNLDVIREIGARLIVEQQPSETLLAKRPVPYRTAVEMDEVRIWIPADPTAPHCTGSQHRVLEPDREIDVEG